MSSLRIQGGKVHDPANGIDGAVQDICIRDGRIVEALPTDAPIMDARGLVIMAGGVDIHSHVAGGSCNQVRRLLPEEHMADPAPAPHLVDGEPQPRSGTGGTVPTTFTTGYRYAGLGYTTVFDAAVPPISARHAHHELNDTPILDTGFYALLGNDRFLLDQIGRGEREKAREYVGWLLGATGGYAVKIVNPGGVEQWKNGGRNVATLDDPVGPGKTTARTILETLTDAANVLKLPHPVHIHCNNLGQAGNVATTLATMQALAGKRAHLTHLQFHAYGGGNGQPWSSAAPQLVEFIDGHPELSVDVGQVMFGNATTVTADSPVEYLLSTSTGRKWINVDIELESGCGIVPYTYKEKAAVAALQWAVGLELFLLAKDPWRVVLSTDHPNGGTFHSYPELIRLLMDRTWRDDVLKRVNQKMLAGSKLLDGLSREFSLNEIAIITRAGPARQLGLTNKGHLGVGADADITLYSPDPDFSKMFSTPRFVLKGGIPVVEEGQLRRAPQGRRLMVAPAYDAAIKKDLAKYFEAHSSVALANYPVSRELMGAGERK